MELAGIGMVCGGKFCRKSPKGIPLMRVWRCIGIDYVKRLVLGEYGQDTVTVPFSQVEVVDDGYEHLGKTEADVMVDVKAALASYNKPKMDPSAGWDFESIEPAPPRIEDPEPQQPWELAPPADPEHGDGTRWDEI